MGEKRSYDISLEDARILTSRYREFHSGNYRAAFFPKEEIMELLEQGGCNGLRIYFGVDDENKMRVVLVGTEPSDVGEDCGDDMLEKIKDNGLPCPPYSSIENDLNSD